MERPARRCEQRNSDTNTTA